MNATRKLAVELLLKMAERPEEDALNLIEGYMRMAQILQLEEMMGYARQSTRNPRED